MARSKPKFVYDENGKKVGVVLDPKEFEKLVNELEDYQDYELIQQRSRKKEKLYSLEEVIKETLERIKR
jgi:PHD/YefM family antitoxin component YafN of YafNO toxin-antitoxin module